VHATGQIVPGSPKVLKSKDGGDNDGVYVSVNYHYIHRLHYDNDISNARFDTDTAGMIALSVPAQPPVIVDRTWSNSGSGRAVDFGTNVVTGPWDFHVTANGVGNQIVWDNPVHSQYTLSYLLNGENSSVDFVKTSLPATSSTITVKLPVQYAGGAAYRAKKWTGRGQLARGVNGREYHFGGEYHFGPFDSRRWPYCASGIQSKERTQHHQTFRIDTAVSPRSAMLGRIARIGFLRFGGWTLWLPSRFLQRGGAPLFPRSLTPTC
jgi:hypothetical protein